MAKMLAVEENIKSCVSEYHKLFEKSMSILIANMGQHSLKTDLCFEALAYLSLKAEFKSQHLISRLN